jgi:hypothetical protein
MSTRELEPFGIGHADDAPSVLGGLRTECRTANLAEARKLQYAAAWAAMHSSESITPVAWDGQGQDWGEHDIPVAGAGAPAVAEFCVAEFAAVMDVSTDSGRLYLGEAVELRYRLPRLWARVVDGDLPAWKARRVAKETMRLPFEGATFVDRHVAAVAHKIGYAALERLIEEALVRFDPETAESDRRKAAGGRHFDVHTEHVGYDGTVAVDGLLDLADALDLDLALSRGAAELAALGSEESLDVRRSQAAGDLARRQLALDLTATRQVRVKPRQVVIHAHLSDAAAGSGTALVRIEEAGGFVSIEQLKTWCANPDTHVTIKPVIDLDQRWWTDAYEIPDRMHEQVALRDRHCVFPWCTRPARRCDTDHAIPYDSGGPTSPQNLAPLCRRHHRHKTHTAWAYTFIDDGTYLWTSPHRYQFLVDPTGTQDVTRRPEP